jgi:hemerythrin-like domain-containing protein
MVCSGANSDVTGKLSMSSIVSLLDEHRLIEQVLNCLERMTEEASRAGSLDSGPILEAVAFFRAFVHGWHFPREEVYVGRAMGPEIAGQPGDWHFHDHRLCDEHLREMERAAAAGAAGDPRAVERFVEHAHAYITVLMKHIEDEEDRVFPTVERLRNDERESEAVRAMRQTESQVARPRALEDCVAIAHRLADRFNVPKAVPSNAGA